MAENMVGNNLPCYLKFNMRGCQTHKTYMVEPETWDRLEAILDSPMVPPDGFGFFSFDTVDGRAVSISVPDIQMVNYPGSCADKNAAEPGFIGVRMYFRGSLMPVDATLSDDIEAFFLESVISSTSRDEPFFSFLDGNGERCSFSLEHLVILELSAKQVSRGLIEEQMAEQQASALLKSF